MSGSKTAVVGWYNRCLKADLVGPLQRDAVALREMGLESMRDIIEKMQLIASPQYDRI
jgi:hypothetical protein